MKKILVIVFALSFSAILYAQRKIEKVENINSVSTTEESVSKILKRKVACFPIGSFSLS